MTGLSRSKVDKLCSAGAVRLDGAPAGKSASHSISAGLDYPSVGPEHAMLAETG